MAIQQRTCSHHTDRPAIGVCVITKQAICAECSTRYEGVNYSKEGLEILKRQRAARSTNVGMGQRLATIFVIICSPALLFGLYAYYLAFCQLVIDWKQLEP